MNGVVFKVTVPTEEHEYLIIEQIKRKLVDPPSKTPTALAEDHHVFFCKSERNPSPKRETVKQKSGSCECLRESIQVESPTPMQKSMKQVLEGIINEMKIHNAVWDMSSNKKFYQITFPIESRERCEKVLNLLKVHEIGRKFRSVVSVIPCSIYYCEDDNEEEVKDKASMNPEDKEKEHMRLKGAWNRFVSSVRARLVVAQVAENIKANATLTFDFVCLLIIASILCALGLVENSSMILLSSMLISPMMRPVMAGTFGSVIGDAKLQKTGVQNEVISLGIATLIGFCYGVIICLATDKYGDTNWPTYEMTSRGEIRSLWVGCLVALLSGAAVALGILSDVIASLVGAAISISLMPPAVNAGLLWSLTLIYYLKDSEDSRYSSLTFTSYYSENKTIELTIKGAVSMCLTFINIVCIYFAGILVFKIKEVAPMTSTDQAKKEFWNHDIKIARDYNKTLQSDEAKNIKSQLHRTAYAPRDIRHSYQEAEEQFQHHSLNIVDEATASTMNMFQRQYTWSPCTYCPASGDFNKYFCDGKTVGENRIKTLRFNVIKQESKRRRLSSLFSPNRSLRREENKVPPVETSAQSSPASSLVVTGRKKRFIVTPCNLDNIKH